MSRTICRAWAIVVREMVGDPRRAGMKFAAAEVLGSHDFAGGGSSPAGGPPKKIVPWLRTMTASSLMAGT
ncbi:MAG: hypothetical protein V9E98_03830 [Candidatus Nanopelagicales bacterium]